ncbi:MAG: tyrosine-protein phosphatase [Candidatus Babeliales bacterium]
MRSVTIGICLLIALTSASGCGKREPRVTREKVASRHKNSLCDNMADFWFYRLRTVQKEKCYRSGQLSSKRLHNCIERYGIKSIINLRGYHPELAWWQKEKGIADEHGVLLYNIAMNSKTLHSKELITALLSIFDTAPHPILVHCASGVDRAGEAAALWLLAHENAHKKKAAQQLSYQYFHVPALWGGGTMDFFIKIWRNKEWALQEYNPTDYLKQLAHVHR